MAAAVTHINSFRDLRFLITLRTISAMSIPMIGAMNRVKKPSMLVK